MRRAKHQSVRMSNLSAGVNCFVEEAGRNQCARALNVINDEGQVRRRDAFIPVASGAPHMLPVGAAKVHTIATNDSVSASSDSSPDLSDINGIVIGVRAHSAACPAAPFDGFDLRGMYGSDTVEDLVPTEHVVLGVRYWNGSAFVDVPSFVDETTTFVDGYKIPFTRSGAVYWHTQQFVDEWAASTINSVEAYYIEVRFRALNGDQTTVPATRLEVVDAPGFTPFMHGPVNGLFPARIEGRSSIVFGSDRRHRQPDAALLELNESSHLASGLERGAQLGTRPSAQESTRPALLLEDEGSGLWDETFWPTTIAAGESLECNSTADGMTAADLTEWDGLTKCTWSFWFRTTAYGTGQLFTKGNPKIGFGSPASSGRFYFTNGLTIQTTDSAITLDDWHHIVIIYDGTIAPGVGSVDRVQFYVDGVQQSRSGTSVSATLAATTTLFTVGGIIPASTTFYFDDFATWLGTAATGAQAVELYHSGSRWDISGSTLGAPTHWYKFDGDYSDDGSAPQAGSAVSSPAFNSSVVAPASGDPVGTADALEKLQTEFYDAANLRFVPYEWPKNAWRGGQHTGELTPQASFSTSTVLVDDTTFDSKSNGFYRGARIRVMAKGAGGTPLSEEREIANYEVTAGVATFWVFPVWSTAPDADNRFAVIGPEFRVALDEDPDDTFEVFNNDTHTLTLTSEVAYQQGPETSFGTIGRVQFWHLGRELRWQLDAAERWSGAVDLVTGRLILANGGPLLEFDGQHLRRLRADVTSLRALSLVGQIPDSQNSGTSEPRALALSLLRSAPPAGKFVVQHQSSLFVAGIGSSGSGGGDANRVMWSAPGAANNIWPYANESFVADQEADPITGMWTIGDRLIIGTPTALHEMVSIGVSPFYNAVPIARGIGFVAHQAVAVISGTAQVSQLVGVAADGIYAYSGGEPTIVLDDWSRLIPEGINPESLRLAVAVAAPQRSWCLFAVPTRGSSSNNRILVWDYFRNHWWVWTAPFGISSMAVDYSESGEERILFGTDDGYVMTLGPGTTDDGTEIEAYAITPPVEAPSGSEMQASGVLLSARSLGPSAAQQMEVSLLRGDNLDEPIVEGVVTVDKGDSAWNAPLWNAFSWRAHGYKTVEMRVPSETKGHRFALKVGGSVMWELKDAELLVRELARKGRG